MSGACDGSYRICFFFVVVCVVWYVCDVLCVHGVCVHGVCAWCVCMVCVYGVCCGDVWGRGAGCGGGVLGVGVFVWGCCAYGMVCCGGGVLCVCGVL